MMICREAPYDPPMPASRGRESVFPKRYPNFENATLPGRFNLLLTTPPRQSAAVITLSY